MDSMLAKHAVPEWCAGEVCGMCWRSFVRKVDATHKVSEVLSMSGSLARHELTQYVCCRHFAEIFGAKGAAFVGCSIEL